MSEDLNDENTQLDSNEIDSEKFKDSTEDINDSKILLYDILKDEETF